MVEVFKTNVQGSRSALTLIAELERLLPGTQVNFDLQDCDRILRVEGTLMPDALGIVVSCLASHGHQCEPLE